jgi:hypothetical protein
MALSGTSLDVTDGTGVYQIIKMERVNNSKKIAILQSNYIPWKGYFDIINSVDEFVIYDEVQYTKRDWRNRNLIKTNEGPKWLTIPVSVKGNYYQKIKDTQIADNIWPLKHWKSISMCYSHAPFFKEYKNIFEELYLSINSRSLSEINLNFIEVINKIMDIRTRISSSFEYKIGIGKTERLIQICKQAEADEYISGPSAKAYIYEDLFATNNIKLTYFNYDGYKEYDQLFPPFEHSVSIIDLIFNKGPDSTKYLKSYKNA